jgi:DNA repair exonuclease SbcCD nuclease subunit
MKNGELYGIVGADFHFGKKDDFKLYEELKAHFIPKIETEGDDVDYVVLSGDLFDRVLKMNEIGSNLCIKFILELVDLSIKYDFKIRILKGTKTHDFNQLNNFKSIEAKHYPRFKIIQTVEQEEIFPEVFFLYLPEEYVDDPKEYYKEFFEVEEGVKYDMIFFHGTFDYVGYIPNVESERHVKNAPIFNSEQIANLVYGKAIGGHIHTRTVYKNKIEYTSSFSRFCFGEDKPKGFVEAFYNLETLECKTNFIENTDAPKFITIDIDDLEGTSLEEKMSIVNDMKKEYENLRIIAKNVNDKDVSAMKSLVSEDDAVKLDIKRSDIEDKVEEQYMFIINREYDTETTTQKYIKLEHDLDIPLDVIKKAISKEA